jgi:hypothetical protein
MELVLAGIGVVMSAAMIAAIPWVVQRLPADHFVRQKSARPLAHTLLRNAVGIALIGIGVVLLFLPGQGVLTILLGVSILDLPIKDRVASWLLQKAPVRQGLQTMRARMGRAPLVLPPLQARAGATS